jgi:hypothetical protein
MRYRITAESLDSEQIEQESQQLLNALKTDARLREEASQAGIDLSGFDDSVAQASDEPLIKVEAESAGVAPGVIEISLIFAPVVAAIIQDCWTHLILPRLKRRYGVDAIEEVPDR